LAKKLSVTRKESETKPVLIDLSQDIKADELSRSICYTPDERLSQILSAIPQMEGYLGIEGSEKVNTIFNRGQRFICYPHEEGFPAKYVALFFKTQTNLLSEKVVSFKESIAKFSGKINSIKALSEEKQKESLNKDALTTFQGQLLDSQRQLELYEYKLTVFKEFKLFNGNLVLDSKIKVELLPGMTISLSHHKMSEKNFEIFSEFIYRHLLNYSFERIKSSLNKITWKVIPLTAYKGDVRNFIQPLTSNEVKKSKSPEIKYQKKGISVFNFWAPLFELPRIRFSEKEKVISESNIIDVGTVDSNCFASKLSLIAKELKKRGITLCYKAEIVEEEDEETDTVSSSGNSSPSDLEEQVLGEIGLNYETYNINKLDINQICYIVARLGYYPMPYSNCIGKDGKGEYIVIGQASNVTNRLLNSIKSFEKKNLLLFPHEFAHLAALTFKAADDESYVPDFMCTDIGKLDVKSYLDYTDKDDNLVYRPKVLHACDQLIAQISSGSKDVPPKKEETPEPKSSSDPKVEKPKEEKKIKPKEEVPKPTKKEAEEPKPKAKVQKKKKTPQSKKEEASDKDQEKKESSKEPKPSKPKREAGQSRVNFYHIEEADLRKLSLLLHLKDKERLPSWVITGFGRLGESFIKALEEKKVSKDNFSTWLSQNVKLKQKDLSQSEIERQWAEIKKGFKGVALLINPTSKDEKAYLAKYRKFLKENPTWKNKPNLGKDLRKKETPPMRRERDVPRRRREYDDDYYYDRRRYRSPVRDHYRGSSFEDELREKLSFLKVFKDIFSVMKS
jgi:hypothetical protein